MSDWSKRFEERFVIKDKGPDGDGYDIEPDEWNGYFLTGEDYEQIERIENFIEAELKRQREESKGQTKREWYMKGHKDARDEIREEAKKYAEANATNDAYDDWEAFISFLDSLENKK